MSPGVLHLEHTCMKAGLLSTRAAVAVTFVAAFDYLALVLRGAVVFRLGSHPAPGLWFIVLGALGPFAASQRHPQTPPHETPLAKPTASKSQQEVFHFAFAMRRTPY